MVIVPGFYEIRKKNLAGGSRAMKMNTDPIGVEVESVHKTRDLVEVQAPCLNSGPPVVQGEYLENQIEEIDRGLSCFDADTGVASTGTRLNVIIPHGQDVRSGYHLLCESHGNKAASSSDLDVQKKFWNSLWKLNIPNKGRNQSFMPSGLVRLYIRCGVPVSQLYPLNFPGVRNGSSDEAEAEAEASSQMIKDNLILTTFGDITERLAEESKSYDTCAVCLNKLRVQDEVRELRNCCHVFHRECIDRWVDHGPKLGINIVC
nr:e3 ubiquitin-protein ligase [Quercus suber]